LGDEAMTNEEQSLKSRQDIAEFAANLEEFSKRKLNNPLEITELLQMVHQSGLTHEFENLIFLAKFLVRTQEVMKQIGPEAEGYEKLSLEFNSSVQESMDMLKFIIGKVPEDTAREYSERFLTMNTDSFSRLMKLYADLSWIKNWQIDGNPLPYETNLSKTIAVQENTNRQTLEKIQHTPSEKSLSLVQRSAVLTGILFVLFLLLDPPVTILGWVLSLWIAALLVYIVIQMLLITGNKNSHRIDFK
jgi:hypothetical protein